MATLDREKHDFDVLEHVLGGGVHATDEEHVSGLVSPQSRWPELFGAGEREVSIAIGRRRRSN